MLLAALCCAREERVVDGVSPHPLSPLGILDNKSSSLPRPASFSPGSSSRQPPPLARPWMMPGKIGMHAMGGSATQAHRVPNLIQLPAQTWDVLWMAARGSRDAFWTPTGSFQILLQNYWGPAGRYSDPWQASRKCVTGLGQFVWKRAENEGVARGRRPLVLDEGRRRHY